VVVLVSSGGRRADSGADLMLEMTNMGITDEPRQLHLQTMQSTPQNAGPALPFRVQGGGAVDHNLMHVGALRSSDGEIGEHSAAPTDRQSLVQSMME
jgi:hypothetical protein